MNEMKPFRFWVQSVLPVVYDDSLSYYELLCKVVSYINKLIENDNYLKDKLDEVLQKVDNIEEVIEGDVEEYLDTFVQSEEFINIVEPLVQRYVTEAVGRTFNTFAEAVDANVETGASFHTIGFYSANDGGGGSYIVRDSVEEEPYAAYGSKYAVLCSELNIKSLGAHGDGVADDTSVFEIAANSSKPLILPNGTYKVIRPITFSNKDVIGSGAVIDLTSAVPYDSVFLRWRVKTDGKLSGITVRNEGNQYLAYVWGCDQNVRCTYENLKIFGNNGYCFRMNKNSYCTIDNIYAENIVGEESNPGGIIFAQEFAHCVIRNIKCNRIADHAIYLVHETHDVAISDCVLNEAGYNSLTSGAAIIVYGSTKNVTITNCVCTSCKGGISAQAYQSETSPENISICNCLVINCTLDGFTFYGTNENIIKNSQIIGCRAVGCGQDSYNIRYTENCYLAQCTALDGGRDAIQIVDCVSLIVESCFVRMRTGNPGFYTGRGSSLGTKNLTIRNCIVEKYSDTAYGYALQKVDGLFIDNCKATGATNSNYDINISNSVNISANRCAPNRAGNVGVSFGSGAPSAYVANAGDFYINTDNTDNNFIYQYVNGAWTVVLTR